jgi:site-specific DNA recombinase
MQRKRAQHERRRVVGPVRISKDRDGETSTETQAQAITKWCELHGAELIEVVEDKGRSAYKNDQRYKREGVRRSLQLLQAGAVNTVVVYKVSRIARNARDLLNLVHEIENLGGTFVSVTEQFDTSTAMGRAMLTIIGALAELESATKSEILCAWQDRRRALKLTPTGPRPYGYRRERNELHIIEEEAVIIKELAQRTLDGESGRSLTAWLKQTDRTRVHDGRWSSSLTQKGISKVLTSPTTAALRDVEGVFIDCSDTWEPILDRATWDELRAVLLSDGRGGRPKGGMRTHLLSGLLICGKENCDGRMQTKMNGGRGLDRHRYACVKCHQSLYCDDAEQVVESTLKGLLDPAAWVALRRRGNARVDTHELERQLSDALARFESDELTYDEWLGVSRKIKRDLAAVAEQPLELPNVKDPVAEWDYLDIEQKRLLISAVFSRIIVTPIGKRGYNGPFDPERIVFVPVT